MQQTARAYGIIKPPIGMKIFKHFIFTRYNLGLYENALIEDKVGWMERRLHLFDKCADSVKAQTNQDFTWIIAIDPKTPKRDFKRIQKVNTFNSVVCSEYPPDFLRKIAKNIKQEWIITSRLDNDDLLEPDYIKEIQDNFKGKLEVLDVKGRQLEVSSGKYYETGRDRPNSPFLSLIEPNNDLKTCFYCNHTTMDEKFDSRLINKQLYVQVIHQENVCNKIKGKLIEQ